MISVPSVTSLWTSCDFGASVVDDDDLHAGSTLYMCALVSSSGKREQLSRFCTAYLAHSVHPR